MRYLIEVIKVVVISYFLVGCQSTDLTSLKSKPAALFTKVEQAFTAVADIDETKLANNETKPLSKILDGALADQNNGVDFVSTMVSAVLKDPSITKKRKAVSAKLAAVGVSEAKKNYQVTGAVYGGIEDVTDNTKGVAVELNASRLVFDGGFLDAQIAATVFEAEAEKLELQGALEDRASRLGEIWIELEKYQRLQELIDDRLAVLNPLISQLEQVAKAGIGDVSKVTAAQRTVSGIRMAQTNVSEGLALAQLEYVNEFGAVNKPVAYDPVFVQKLIPDEVDDSLAENSPVLLAKYARYKASLASLAASKAKDDFNVGFRVRAMRPFAGSNYDSDESLGLVASKTLFSGGMLESEIAQAQSNAEAALADVEFVYRQGIRIISSSKQSIESLEGAIYLARDNAKVTADEITYLKQQLVIGGSTLDSVLSAEARLYDAESKEILFHADKLKAELVIASKLGLLSPALGLN